jgi:predicted amino acid racemase
MRIYGKEDDFVDSHAGGFLFENLPEDFAFLTSLPNIEVAGFTSYPTASFDRLPRVVKATSNVKTMGQSAEFLRQQGVADPQINWPSEVTSVSLDLCIASGATQVEPGHAFTGTSPYQVFEPHPEKQAIVYVSEVSHLQGNGGANDGATSGYFFGGGLYECIGAVEHTHQAIVGKDASYLRAKLALPAKGVIDFYGRLDFASNNPVRAGDSVIVCSRPQAFFTRAYVVPVKGISTSTPEALGVWETNGFPAAAAPVLFVPSEGELG